VDTAPILLNQYGLPSQLDQLGWQVKINDTLQNCNQWKPESDPDVGVIKAPRFVGAVNKALADEVRQHCERGELALTLGGDHSLAVGTISGSTLVYGDDLCVIWIDAHAVN
jgi:arginase